jgi:hypothetical protein
MPRLKGVLPVDVSAGWDSVGLIPGDPDDHPVVDVQTAQVW